MDKILVFRACDASRRIRHVIPSAGNVISLIEQGSHNFNKQFSQIVLENDGCQITSDLALNAFANHLLMLLTPEEIWTPNNAFTTANESCIQSEEPTNASNEQIVIAQPSNYFQKPLDTESSSLPFLHQVQLAPNMMTFISNPQGGLSVEDPIAMQLMTDMEEQNEEQLEERSMQFETESTSKPETKIVTTGTKSNNQEAIVNQNGDPHDENHSPNLLEKQILHEQPGYQKSNKKHATSVMKFRSFEINWTKISDNLLTRLKSLQDYRLQNPSTAIPRLLRFKKNEMSSLVNALVDQLRCIDTNIRADTMETVSKQVLRRYPCLEILDDDGFGNGLSHITIKHKMINRNTYLNRLNEPIEKTPLLIQKPRNRRAGTVQEYWKTTSDECSKEIFSKLRRDEPSLLTEEFLNESQPFVRSRLDQQKGLKFILSELPVLRRRKLLNHHFKQATGVDIETLRKYFNSKRAKIIDYTTTQKACKLQETSTDYEVFNFLAKSVGEVLSDLVLKKEIGTRIDDVREESTGPVLICIDIGNDIDMYYVFADHTRLTEGTTEIVCAIQDLMCVQYVHSFMYLKTAAKFLELVQEYLLKIFPTKGSKSNATRIGQQQRMVKKVIASLSNHEASFGEKKSTSAAND